MTASELDNLHLADLHGLAAEHGVAGYRKLRRRELIRALQETDTDELAVLSDEPEAAPEAEPEAEEKPAPAREGRVRPRRRPIPSSPAKAEEDEPVVVEGKLLSDEEPAEEDEEDLPTDEVQGVLELTRQRYGFLRLSGLAPDPADVYVSAAQVRRCELRPGDEVAGPARQPRRGERHRALVHVDSVNGADPTVEEARPEFEELPAVLPEKRIPLEKGAEPLVRAVDLLAPLAFGQRVLVRAAPRSGRTTLLRALAAAIAATDARVVVLLVDERPEEATAWREALPAAEFAIATADQAPIEQLRTAELALERSRRLAETGGDAVLICDSLSRIAVAGGGVDEVKRLFGSGRKLAGGGSLTVIATTVEGTHDEGEAERAVLTTESSLITLDPDLAADGVYPALDPAGCRISNEDSLREPDELAEVRKLRSELTELEPRQAAERLAELLS